MKRLLLFFVATLLPLFAFEMNADERKEAKKIPLTYQSSEGYSGRVSASLSADCGFVYDMAGMISTSHGYEFGNGLWIGGGVGVFLPFEQIPSFPFFSEMKYSWRMGKVNPYASCKVGMCLWEFAEDFHSYINPEIGIDIGGLSVFMGYNDMEIVKFTNIGVAWNF